MLKMIHKIKTIFTTFFNIVNCLAMRFKHSALLLLSLALIALSCDKDKQPSIPYVYVNEIVYPNTLDYVNITGYKYINAGYRGIIVYRLAENEFKVYERCCPYDPENTNARVSVESSYLTAVDTCCNSHFSLLDGSPYEGPSPYSLMMYNYSYDGDRLYIYN